MLHLQHSFAISCDQVNLQIYPGATAQVAQCRVLHGVGNQVDAHLAAIGHICHAVDREAHAVDGDRTLDRDELCQILRCRGQCLWHAHHQLPAFAEIGKLDDFADPVDMPADEVPAKPVRQAQCLFQIDRCALRTQSDGAIQRLARYFDNEGVGSMPDHRQAYAVYRNAVSDLHVAQIQRLGRDHQPQSAFPVFRPFDAADVGDYSTKHFSPLPLCAGHFRPGACPAT